MVGRGEEKRETQDLHSYARNQPILHWYDIQERVFCKDNKKITAASSANTHEHRCTAHHTREEHRCLACSRPVGSC